MLRAFLLLVLVLFSASSPAFAHPHLFVDNKLTFMFDESGLAGMLVEWKFDDMYSSGIIYDFDNGDGVFSKQENALLKRDNFSNLKKYDFFLEVVIDSSPFKVVFVQDFEASINNGRLVYRFFVPCHVSAGQHTKTIHVGVVDETNFVAITTQKEDVLLQKAEPLYRTELAFTPTSEFLQILSPNAIDRVALKFWKP